MLFKKNYMYESGYIYVHAFTDKMRHKAKCRKWREGWRQLLKAPESSSKGAPGAATEQLEQLEQLEQQLGSRMCDKVKVAVRVRPLNKRENGNYSTFLILHSLLRWEWPMKDDIWYCFSCVSEVGTSCIVEVKGNSILLHSPLQQGASRYSIQSSQRKFISWRPRFRSSWSN